MQGLVTDSAFSLGLMAHALLVCIHFSFLAFSSAAASLYPINRSKFRNVRNADKVSPRDRISLLSEIQSACDENLGGGLGFVPPILFITNLLIGTPWRADLRGHLCNGQIKGIIIIIKTFPNLDLFLKEGEGGMLTRLKQLKRS
jgi:hypothetical protein